MALKLYWLGLSRGWPLYLGDAEGLARQLPKEELISLTKQLETYQQRGWLGKRWLQFWYGLGTWQQVIAPTAHLLPQGNSFMQQVQRWGYLKWLQAKSYFEPKPRYNATRDKHKEERFSREQQLLEHYYQETGEKLTELFTDTTLTAEAQIASYNRFISRVDRTYQAARQRWAGTAYVRELAPFAINKYRLVYNSSRQQQHRTEYTTFAHACGAAGLEWRSLVNEPTLQATVCQEQMKHLKAKLDNQYQKLIQQYNPIFWRKDSQPFIKKVIQQYTDSYQQALTVFTECWERSVLPKVSPVITTDIVADKALVALARPCSVMPDTTGLKASRLTLDWRRDKQDFIALQAQGDAEAIRARYLKLAKKYHSDQASEEDKQTADAIFIELIGLLKRGDCDSGQSFTAQFTGDGLRPDEWRWLQQKLNKIWLDFLAHQRSFDEAIATIVQQQQANRRRLERNEEAFNRLFQRSAQQDERLTEIGDSFAKVRNEVAKLKTSSARQDEQLTKLEDSFARELNEVKTSSARQDEQLTKLEDSFARELDEVKTSSARQSDEIRMLHQELNQELEELEQLVEERVGCVGAEEVVAGAEPVGEADKPATRFSFF